MTPIRIIKIGGRVIEQPEPLTEFLGDFARLEGSKLLVHGGGRNATQLAQRLGREATLIDGRRVTDDAMLEIVVMVYGDCSINRLSATCNRLVAMHWDSRVLT